MIVSTEALSQIAQLEAGRRAEEGDMNAARLDTWQRRYPWDVVEVPSAKEPPKWPAQRCSIPARKKVVQFSAARRP